MRIPFSSCKCSPRCCQVVDYQRLNADLMAYIDKLRNAEPEGRKRSNELGWQSEDFDFGVPVVAEFATLALERARQYGLAHSWRFPSHMQLAVWDLWANANGKLASNNPHNHPNSILSGVYYVKAEGDCGDLLFLDSRKQATMLQPDFSERTPINSAVQYISPEVGTMIMFPSWLEHGVKQNMSDAERISIAFNMEFVDEQMK